MRGGSALPPLLYKEQARNKDLQHRSAARPPADRKPAAEEEDSTFAACRRLAVTAGTRPAEGQRRRPSVPALTASGEALRRVSLLHPARLLAW
ncbi:unnamed protein product, partial [Musa hybrid cultivar]